MHSRASNVIPLGARVQHALPIPLRSLYRAEIRRAFAQSNIDLDKITSLFEQRWLSLTQLIKYLRDAPSLTPVWENFGARNDDEVESMMLRVAFQLRFEKTNASVYELTPDAQQHAHQRDAQHIQCRALSHNTDKPVYIQLPSNSPFTYYFNGDINEPIEGAFFQCDNAGPIPIFYYQLHAKSSPTWHPSLSGNITLSMPNDNLAYAAQQLMPGQLDNQEAIKHMLTVWTSWASKQYTEFAYMEHDLIAAEGISNKRQRLEGAYNRIILDERAA